MPRRLWAILCVAACLAATTRPALAAPDDSLISRLISQGRVDAARAALEAAEPTEIDRMFFEARLLKAQGRLDDALAVLWEIIRRAPAHINARREYAHTLLVSGRFEAAEIRFRALLDADPNPAMRAGYQQFLSVIAQNRPWGMNGRFAILPSSNVNRGASGGILKTVFGDFRINPESRADSGVGIRLGGSGFVRGLIGPQTRATLTLDPVGEAYPRGDYENLSLTASYAVEHEAGDWRLSVTPYGRVTWREDGGDSRALGASAQIGRALGASLRADVTLQAEERRYQTQTHNDGPYFNAAAALGWQVDGALRLTAGLGVEKHRPEAAHARFIGLRGFVGLAKSWEGGFTLGFGAEIGRRDFAADFPLVGAPRADRTLRLTASLEDSRLRWRGFQPRLSCSLAFNASNIGLYDHRAQDCEISVTKDF